MTDFLLREKVNDRLLQLYGGDPFFPILSASESHRLQHGAECGLYPAGPQVMRAVSMLVKAHKAKRILDIGSGSGYSACWLAQAAGDGAEILSIDRFSEHVELANQLVQDFPFASRITFLLGEASKILNNLSGKFDLIHDDGWFVDCPVYYDRIYELLERGGIWTMPNWFLLEDAITEIAHQDWSNFKGKDWPKRVMDYAVRLASDDRYYVNWSVSPPLGVAIKI